MEMISKKESAGLAAFSPEWNAGFKQGKFATVACPAWMMGYIKDQAPDTTPASGTWPRSRAAAATGAARSSPSRSSRSTRRRPTTWPPT